MLIQKWEGGHICNDHLNIETFDRFLHEIAHRTFYTDEDMGGSGLREKVLDGSERVPRRNGEEWDLCTQKTELSSEEGDGVYRPSLAFSKNVHPKPLSSGLPVAAMIAINGFGLALRSMLARDAT